MWRGEEEECSGDGPITSTPARPSVLMRPACEVEAPALFTTKTDSDFVSVLCLCGRNLQVPSFFSVCVFVFLPLEVLSVIVFMLTMWTPTEALSAATCSVNKCDYIYFVHSYDRRIIFSLIQAELMMSLLPLKKNNKKNTGVFVARPQTSKPGSVNRLPRVSINSTREPLLSQNKLLPEEKAFSSEWMTCRAHRMYYLND